MKVAIRWKLMASYLLLVLMIGGVLYGYLNHTLGNNLVAEIKAGLLSEGRLARLTAVKEVVDMPRDAPAAAAAIARETRARVTIMNKAGMVLGDSDVSPEKLPELENHGNRVEVRAALEVGEGSAIRYSATLRTSMLYVAFPFESGSGEAGVLRLALPLAAVQKAKSSLHTILGAAMILATVISLVLSYIFSNVTSRSLRSMAAIAAHIGKGEHGRRIPVTSRDEIGELATVINEMALRIEGQLVAISLEKTRLDTILRGMGEGLMVADGRGVVTLVNPAFRALFAIHDDVEGRPLIEISRHPALHEAFRVVVETKTERLEEMTLPIASEKVVLTHWVPLLAEAASPGVVAVFHDITDIKRLERVRKDFVANVSHELRTPVTVIKGFAETLLEDPKNLPPEQVARFAGIIYNHSERLACLIGDLLALSTLESGISLELAPVSLDGEARQAMALLEQKARDNAITLTLNPIAAPQVLVDRGRLEQVLVNLLDNALNHTPANGRVTISAVEAGGMVRVSVADTGVGIPEKDLPRIFERFYRVDAARSREIGGTGLGLSIVNHIIQLHGGVTTVESTPGKGSTFSFTLKKA